MSVTARKLEHRITRGTSLEDWMQDWVLDTPTEVDRSARFRSFQEVSTEAGIMLEANKDILFKNPSRSPKLEDKSTHTDPVYHKILYETLCLPNAKRLSLILKQEDFDKFVIAFDECSVLGFESPHTESRGPSQDMSLIALQRIIKAGDQYDLDGVTIWYLLLDTNSSIFDLAPVGPNAPSYRLTAELTPLPVWPYLGFNQMVNPTHAQNIRHAADVLSLEHLKVYGRPVSGGTCCSLYSPPYNVPCSTGLALATMR
jgi:hypothetical protein